MTDSSIALSRDGAPPSVTPHYAVSEIDLCDSTQVKDLFGLWEEIYPGVLETKFDWMYRRGPAGVARVWMIRAGDGQVAGAAAVFPRLARIDGVLKMVGLAGDFLIHPSHRVLGPAMTLQRRICAEATKGWVEFLYGFPNLTAEPMFRHVGFTPLADRMRLVVPIRTAPRLLDLKGGSSWGPMIAPLTDTTLRLRHWFRRRTAGLTYRESRRFDERFEQLWDRVAGTARVAIERSASYLSWRYLEGPPPPSTIIEALDEAQQLIGYAVVRVIESSVSVCELVAELPRARRGLVEQVWRWGREAGADRLEHFVGNNTVSAHATADTGFVQRPDRHRAMIFVPRAHENPAVLASAQHWWLVQSDADT